MSFDLAGIIIIVAIAGIAVTAFLMVSASKRVCPHCHTMMPKNVNKCPHCQKASHTSA
jgi:hypothetical protein